MGPVEFWFHTGWKQDVLADYSLSLGVALASTLVTLLWRLLRSGTALPAWKKLWVLPLGLWAWKAFWMAWSIVQIGLTEGTKLFPFALMSAVSAAVSGLCVLALSVGGAAWAGFIGRGLAPWKAAALVAFMFAVVGVRWAILLVPLYISEAR